MKDEVLALLTAKEGEYISGEAMSKKLWITRAAVWKDISALREEGYIIDAAPRRGYRLAGGPNRLTAGTILPWLDPGRPREKLICLDSVDSTNNYAKDLALQGGEDNTAVTAEEQTGGRGRLGRSFYSPRGTGVYLTMLYRPLVAPVRAMTLTAYAAVAVCDGIEAACGIRPQIKWTNDIVLSGRKLCGILTEMSLEGESGALQYIIMGIGVNVNQAEKDFPSEVAGMAVSLSQALGREISRGRLCGEIIRALDGMYSVWLSGGGAYWSRYRADCLTLGKPVRIMRGEECSQTEAFAEDIDENFGLIVRYPNGCRETIRAGEVSVRGLWGYV